LLPRNCLVRAPRTGWLHPHSPIGRRRYAEHRRTRPSCYRRRGHPCGSPRRGSGRPSRTGAGHRDVLGHATRLSGSAGLDGWVRRTGNRRDRGHRQLWRRPGPAPGRPGVAVVEVIRPNRQARRRRGKSDTADAIAAAVAALNGEASGTPKSHAVQAWDGHIVRGPLGGGQLRGRVDRPVRDKREQHPLDIGGEPAPTQHRPQRCVHVQGLPQPVQQPRRPDRGEAINRSPSAAVSAPADSAASVPASGSPR